MEDYFGLIGVAVFVLFAIIPAIAKGVGKGRAAQANKAPEARRVPADEPFAEETKPAPVQKSSVNRDPAMQASRGKKKSSRPEKKPAAKPVETHTHVGDIEVAYGETGTENYVGEGCEEHYNLRFLSEELRSVDSDTEISEETAYLRSVLVLGEILNEPKYKEY